MNIKNNCVNDYSIYTYFEINGVVLDLNSNLLDYANNIMFLNFIENFFIFKKFNMYYDLKLKHEHFYFFFYKNPFLTENFIINEDLIFKVNTYPISNKRDKIFYNFFK